MLNVALKEWAVICEALTLGDQVVVLRKGGIAEEGGPGRFSLDHDRFVLFPAWEHQKTKGIKPAWRDRVEEFASEPQHLTLRAVADVAGVWEVPGRSAFDQLDDLHVWDTPQVDMRFNYKPQRPLYLVALRVRRLNTPKTIVMNQAYWGCRSWVDLDPEDEVHDEDSQPVFSDEQMKGVIERIRVTFADL